MPSVPSGFRGAASLRVSPSRWRASRVSVPVCVLSPTQPALSFPPTSQARKSGPQVQERGGPGPGGARGALFPPFLCRRAGRAPAVTPPGGQTEPARTPADKSVSPSIALCRSGQVSLRPATALPPPPGPLGSPAGSGFARHLRRGLPLRCGPARGAPWTWEGAPGQKGGVASGPTLLPGCPPDFGLLSPALGGLFSKERLFSAASFRPSPAQSALEANWYRNSTRFCF